MGDVWLTRITFNIKDMFMYVSENTQKVEANIRKKQLKFQFWYVR
jgi:hypothetical protein